MLHDLLYALNGYPGSVFKEACGKLEVISGFPCISSNEELALNHLLILGSKYLLFQKFIRSHSSASVPDEHLHHSTIVNGLKSGCYLEAFCVGLNEALQSYQNTLLKLERDIVADPYLTLLHIQEETEKFHCLFAVISDIISTIKLRKSHGCQILNVLYSSACSGNSFVRKTLLIILSSCHNVMYKQLSSWLVYGLLVDRYSEFFIVSTSKNKSLKSSHNSSSTLEEQKDSFDVDLNFLPSYISPKVAKVICFIGSSLHLFECDKIKFDNVDVIQESSVDVMYIQEIMQQNQEEFLADIHRLQQANEFVVEDFEACIDRIRISVAKELWKLCVEHGQLISYLNMLKDFLLLGRGELFLVFIDEVGPLLKGPPSRVTGHDLQQIFLRSAAKIQIDDELPFQLFQLTLNSSPKRQSSYANIYSTEDGWSQLEMTFKVKWPLHTIFKSSVMEKYNQLFCFLLKVKRTQIALQRIWSIQMRKQQAVDASNSNLLTPADSSNKSFKSLQWQCRSQMQFFVDNLQYYLLADVLESHFSHLLSKIYSDGVSDFESITVAHDNFLNALLSQCFVMSGVVCSSLIELLDLCQQFCDVIVTSSLLLSKNDVHEQVKKLWELYSKKTCIFFQVLNGVCSSHCNSHVSQLILRLDYNRFYSTMISKSKESSKFLGS